MTVFTMPRRSAADVKALILSRLDRSLFPAGVAGDAIPDDFDLRGEGIVDSLGFVQLMTDLETQLDFEIDLAELDPEQLTVIGPLSRHIADLAAARWRSARG